MQRQRCPLSFHQALNILLCLRVSTPLVSGRSPGPARTDSAVPAVTTDPLLSASEINTDTGGRSLNRSTTYPLPLRVPAQDKATSASGCGDGIVLRSAPGCPASSSKPRWPHGFVIHRVLHRGVLRCPQELSKKMRETQEPSLAAEVPRRQATVNGSGGYEHARDLGHRRVSRCVQTCSIPVRPAWR